MSMKIDSRRPDCEMILSLTSSRGPPLVLNERYFVQVNYTGVHLQKPESITFAFIEIDVESTQPVFQFFTNVSEIL